MNFRRYRVIVPRMIGAIRKSVKDVVKLQSDVSIMICFRWREVLND